MSYYAVKKGRVPGIYDTWDECKQQIHGYSGAKFKKFESLDDAEKFAGIKRAKNRENLFDSFNDKVSIKQASDNNNITKKESLFSSNTKDKKITTRDLKNLTNVILMENKAMQK